LWPNTDAVGKRLSLQGEAWQVVGVVDDLRVWTISDTNRPLIFYPLAQHFQNNVTFVVRTGMDPLEITASVKQAVAQLDPEMAVYNIRSLDRQIATSPMGMAPMRMGTIIAGGQGLIALFLATLGLYGLISHSVKQRTHEIGIRIALGATRGKVLRILIAQGLRLVLIGLGVGLASAFAITRFLSSVLYGVKATDLLTFGGVALLLSGVAFLASWLPARRAASIEPMQALRAE
jgi:ABC-type antimicrobial peptide transport system permease subunit